jgi:hypothetical protein
VDERKTEETEPRPAEPEAGSDEPPDDTEGHSLSTYEYGRSVVRERAREAERFARESRLRREAKDRTKR